jgi:hypothetical protein
VRCRIDMMRESKGNTIKIVRYLMWGICYCCRFFMEKAASICCEDWESHNIMKKLNGCLHLNLDTRDIKNYPAWCHWTTSHRHWCGGHWHFGKLSVSCRLIMGESWRSVAEKFWTCWSWWKIQEKIKIFSSSKGSCNDRGRSVLKWGGDDTGETGLTV